jgi:molecular chaperone HscB
MNYFQLFGLPVSLAPDAALVRKKYFELSRLYHPDYYAQSAEDQQSEALEMSALLNKGLKVLTNADETIRYVLLEKGLMEEEEKYQLSPDFLMDMMELNEELAELERGDEAGRKSLRDRLAEAEREAYEPVRGIVEGYEEGRTTEEELRRVKDYYFRKKYLKRLQGQLGGKV